MPGSRRRRLIAIAVFVAAWPSLSPVEGQLDPIGGTGVARLVDVDVVAVAAGGAPLTDLTREDFRLLVDGREASIEGFSALSAGEVRGSGTGGRSRADGGADRDRSTEQLPLLVIDYDARAPQSVAAAEAIETLRARLGDLLGATRAIMVARQGESLVIEHPFTRDVELLEAALDRLLDGGEPGSDAADRRELIDRIERAESAEAEGLSADDGVVDAARDLLNLVRGHAETERRAQRRAIEQLESLVASVSGLPGRKAIFYLGSGVQARPAEALYRLWWARFGSVAGALGIASLDSEMGSGVASTRRTGLTSKANEARIAFYVYDPGGARSRDAIELDTVVASDLSGADGGAPGDWIRALIRSTGGLGLRKDSDLAGLLSEMIQGFRNCYSLGFYPEADAAVSAPIRVELVNREGRLRHVDGLVARPGGRELGELTLAALLTEMAVNPMQIEVEMDEPERQADGSYVVSLQVKIPIASLSLVPRGDRHIGQLVVAVQAQDDGGELSEPAEGLIPVELENEALMTALNGTAAYRLSMRISEGEQRIAIGVRDEIAGNDSAVRLVIHAGRDS